MTNVRLHAPADSTSNSPDVAMLVSSYNKPLHLRHCLASIACQQGLESPPEIIVTDDGSDPPTLDVVAQAAVEFGLTITLTTHVHSGFQLARCRNDGVRNSTAPYLLFLDGDCVLPPDHVAIHLDQRRPGFVMAGDCCRLDPAESSRITDNAIRGAEFMALGSSSEMRRLRRRHWATWWYGWVRHPRKPSLIGNNVGIWRRDYELVNGYDEEFEGWGCEDDDLARRLRKLGIRIDSILHRTCSYHLWHPVDPTTPTHWKDGRNVARLLAERPAVCEFGLLDRRDDENRRAALRLPSMATRVEELHPISARTAGSPHRRCA